jgi:hypothetical protein
MTASELRSGNTALSAYLEVLRMDLGASDAFSPVWRIIRTQRAIEVLGG